VPWDAWRTPLIHWYAILVIAAVVGLVFAIMAIPVATKAIGKANAEPGRYSGKGMAIAGLATALTSIFLHVVYALLLIASLD